MENLTPSKNQEIKLPFFPISKVTREIEITTNDGLKLHGWHREALGETKGNIVIVHGLKDYSERYLGLASKLSSEGYQVFAFDQRGHARSEGERVYFEDLSLVESDLDNAIKKFKQFNNQGPWILIGHSAGGALVARYALDHQKSIKGFVLSAPPLKKTADLTGFKMGVLKLLNVITPHLPILDLPNDKFSRDSAIVTSMSVDPLISDIKIPVRTAVEFLKNMDYVQSKAQTVKIPFLVLHGASDFINNKEGSKEFFEGAPAVPGKKLKIYPILYHDLLHEPEYEEVESDIISWLNSTLKGEDYVLH